MKQTLYGVVSDIHHDPRVIFPAVDKLKREGVNKLIVNGDIGAHFDDPEQNVLYTATILDAIGKSGLEAYVQPGSHEAVYEYSAALTEMLPRHSNLIDVASFSHHLGVHHELVFIPGSDFRSGNGGYALGTELPTGYYLETTSGGILPHSAETAQKLRIDDELKNIIHYKNINDIRSQVTDPSKTVVVCHVPRKFDDVGTGVDMAYFAQRNDGQGLIPGTVLEQQIRQQYGNVSLEQLDKIAQANGFTLMIENRGNGELKALYQELGLTKAVSGHFHESSHRAHDSNAVPIAQNMPVRELFWNSGHLDAGFFGILAVGDGVVSYKNLRF